MMAQLQPPLTSQENTTHHLSQNLVVGLPMPATTNLDTSDFEGARQAISGDGVKTASLESGQATAPSGASNQPTNSDNENSTSNSTWSSSQNNSRQAGASRRLESSQRLNLILPHQNQKGCLSTPVIVTSDQVSSSGQVQLLSSSVNNCTPGVFGGQNAASSQLLFDSLAHLNGQGEVSLFTGLPSCTPASADRLTASGINPFFWGTTATVNHPIVQNCDQASNVLAQNEALSLQSRPSAGENQGGQNGQPGAEMRNTQNASSSNTNTQNQQHNQTQNGYANQQDQQQQQQQQQQELYQQQRKKLMLANLQAASGLSPLILSPLSLLGLSPEQEAWLRFGYVSPNQHPLAGKSFGQADLNQLNPSHHNHFSVQPMHNHYQQQQQQQQTDTSSQMAAQDLTSASTNAPPTTVQTNTTMANSQQQSNGPATSQQQMFQQQHPSYTRGSCIQFDRTAPNTLQQQQQQQQQQQYFLHGPKMQQFGGKSVAVPTFQISGVERLQQSQQAQLQNQFDASNFATSQQQQQQLASQAQQRDASLAQSQFVCHQGPLRFSPVNYQQTTGTQRMAASAHRSNSNHSNPNHQQQVMLADPRQQSLGQQQQQLLMVQNHPNSLQQQKQQDFISTNNVINQIVGPSSGGLNTPASSQQSSNANGASLQQSSIGNNYELARRQTPQAGQLLMLANSRQAQIASNDQNGLVANARAQTQLQVPEGTISPSSTDNDNSSVTTSATTTNSPLNSRSVKRTSSVSSSGGERDGDRISDHVRPSNGSRDARERARKGGQSLMVKGQGGKVKTKKHLASKSKSENAQNNSSGARHDGEQLIANENGELVPIVKKKSRGGRKKKLVTHEEMIARKNRSKERNRVAARRCRQKRKQFLDELRDKIDGLNNLNQKLHKENAVLRGELEIFKKHHGACNL